MRTTLAILLAALLAALLAITAAAQEPVQLEPGYTYTLSQSWPPTGVDPEWSTTRHPALTDAEVYDILHPEPRWVTVLMTTIAGGWMVWIVGHAIWGPR